MPERANKREKRLAMLVVAAVVVVTVLLIVETFRLLLPGLWTVFSAGDEQALSDYLTSQGTAAQFSDAVVPGRRAGAFAGHSRHAGAAGGGACLWAVARLLTSFSASAVANMSVYLLARRLAPVIRRLVADNPRLRSCWTACAAARTPGFIRFWRSSRRGCLTASSPTPPPTPGCAPSSFWRPSSSACPFPTLLTLRG